MPSQRTIISRKFEYRISRKIIFSTASITKIFWLLSMVESHDSSRVRAERRWERFVIGRRIDYSKSRKPSVERGKVCPLFPRTPFTATIKCIDEATHSHIPCLTTRDSRQQTASRTGCGFRHRVVFVSIWRHGKIPEGVHLPRSYAI